jgi:hypothetical protein
MFRIFINVFRWLTCWLPLWILGKKIEGVPFNVRCVSARNFALVSEHVREMIKEDPDGWSELGAVIVSDLGSHDAGYVIRFDPPFRSVVITVSTSPRV